MEEKLTVEDFKILKEASCDFSNPSVLMTKKTKSLGHKSSRTKTEFAEKQSVVKGQERKHKILSQKRKSFKDGKNSETVEEPN